MTRVSSSDSSPHCDLLISLSPPEHPDGQIDDRKYPADDEEHVSRESQLFDDGGLAMGVEFGPPCMPVSILEAVEELKGAKGERSPFFAAARSWPPPN